MKTEGLIRVLDEVLPVRNYFLKQLQKDLEEAEAELEAQKAEMYEDLPDPRGGRGRARGRRGRLHY